MNEDLQRLLDESAIRDLTAAYCDAVTHLDAACAAAVYVEDGCVEIMGQETCGRAAIEQGMRGSFAAFEILQLIAHGPRINVSGDAAEARWSTIELTVRRDSNQLGIIFGRYEDNLVRTSSGWRFKRRVFTMAGRTQLGVSKLQLFSDFFSVG